MIEMIGLVPVHCNNCGDLFTTKFARYDGRFCCNACDEEFIAKRFASSRGEKYVYDKYKENTNNP